MERQGPTQRNGKDGQTQKHILICKFKNKYLQTTHTTSNTSQDSISTSGKHYFIYDLNIINSIRECYVCP